MEVGVAKHGIYLILLISLVTLSNLSTVRSSSSDLQIVDAERRIDVTSHIVRVYLTLKVENTGKSSASEVLLAFSPEQAKNIANLQAAFVTGKKKKKSYLPLKVNPTDLPDSPNGTKYFTVYLLNPLSTGESVTIEVLYTLTHSLQPFPVEISQSEPQLVYYHDSALILSHYYIKKQKTMIRTPSNKVESFTRVEPADRKGTELKYGPYEDRSPYSYSPITEHYKLAHGGARHKGVFSRVEYQGRPSGSGASSFKHLLAKLPPRVHSVYYRDGIGNISSSHLRSDLRKSELEIEPRYPLFGGWKATFTIGYGLPLQDFLFESDDGRRYLNFSFGCPIAETVVDDLTVKVVLPEGSKNPSALVSFPVEQNLETSYSYLDVVGRTVVVLKKKNVVPEHNIPFQVYYNFHPMFMLAEPLMLTTVFFLLFLTSLAYLHMDISIRKS
ncbi:hypothetical protein AgCh_039764 [Apium graveolens]